MAPLTWDPPAAYPAMIDVSNAARPARPTTSSNQKSKSQSKAERLLGVADTAPLVLPRPNAQAELNKKASRRGFASAFADIKGALTTSRYGSRGRRTPSSPGFGTADSDSMTSMTSPTLNTSTSTSTLPSYHEQPVSPYFSHRGSEPSSPADADIRLEYHATLNPGRYKVASDMPSISEQVDDAGDKASKNLPPLEKPVLTTASRTETPKTMSSFSPINRLRSPSNLSVTTEGTAKVKLFSRRSSKRYTKELYLDYPSTPSTEHQYTTAQPPIPPLPESRNDSSAVEQWLARTDLERRPSMSSTMTRSTLQPQAAQNPPFSPTSSQLSVRTLTTQKEVVPTKANKKHNLDSFDGYANDNKGAAAKTSRPAHKDVPNLYMQSMLSLSSSEDESDPEPRQKTGASSRNIAYQSSSKKTRRASSFASSTTSAPQFLQMQREVILSKSNSTRRGKQRPLQIQPPKDGAPAPFSSVDWQAGDESELASICAAATEMVHSADAGESKAARRETRKKIDSMLLSPTSRVMVVSKKEERLLAQMRENRLNRDKLSSTDESGGESRPPSQPPIISISPSRRLQPMTSELTPVLPFAENNIIRFPAPPGSNDADGRMKKPALSLSLSKETLSEMTSLPEVAPSNSQPPPLPTGELLSFGALTSAGTSYTASDADSSRLTDSQLYTSLPSGIRELQGSIPEPPSILTLEHRRTRSQRASSKIMYTTGLEGSERGGSLLGDDFDGDMAKYVMSSVL